MQSARSYKYLDLVMAAFVTILLISNVASSAKIVDLGFSIRSLPFAFDAGTLMFPLSYIFGDILTEVYGYRRSRRVIWVGFAALAVMSISFWVIQRLPGEEQWLGYAGDTAYGAILGGVSTGGIVVASLAAYFAGEFSNSYLLAKMKVRSKGKHLWKRTIGSTVVGQGIDTAAFLLIATLAGVFPWSLLWTLLVSNYVYKVGVEVLLTPVTYRVVGFLKRAEEEDHFDRDTNFNPFVLS